MYDAMHPDATGKMGPNVSRGNWTLYADRSGKPGFISTGPHGSQLEFWLRFGAQPRLGFQAGWCPIFPDGIPSGADAAQTPATSTARDAAYLLVGLPVRPVGHQVQSCVIALVTRF